jgi:hypothetical protein
VGIDPLRLTRLYVWVLGAGLLLDGALLLVLDRLGVSVEGLNVSDIRHNLLHVVWGIGLLVVSYLARKEGRELWPAWAAVVFGAFYVALGIAGVTLTNPFGLQLGPGENAFHFTVGPLALVLGAWALRTAARPAELRTAPEAPRRARRRPGKARARSRRH